MFSITIPKETATKLCQAVDNEGHCNDFRLFPTGINNEAFLGVTVEHGGITAIRVTLDGVFHEWGYTISSGAYYFRKATEATENHQDIRIEVDGSKVRIYNGNHCDVMPERGDFAFRQMFSTTHMVNALSNHCQEIAAIKLPKRLKKNQALLFDTYNQRVGYFKYIDREPDYTIKEILPLDVIRGQVVSSYGGSIGYYLPWKKGLYAQLIRYIEDGLLVLRFENDGLICLQAALNESNNDERYKQLFNEDNIFGKEIWIEEDDDFLTAGAKK